MISYFGGKNKMSSWIKEYIPNDSKRYVEVFSGAMWIYFNEDFSHCDEIIYNDINNFMRNLYRCSSDPEKMLEHIETAMAEGGSLYFPSDNPVAYKEHFKKMYYDIKKTDFLDTMDFEVPDYDAAVKYLFMLTSAFNGCFPKAAGFSGITKSGKLKMTSFINKLKKDKFKDKLRNLTAIENMDFADVMDKYDSEDTFFYVDAPYSSDLGDFADKTNDRLNWYGVDNDLFGASSHKRLANKLHNTKAKWIMSYYDFPELEQWFPQDKYRWVKKEFFRSSASFSETKSNKGVEVLIMNF